MFVKRDNCIPLDQFLSAADDMLELWERHEDDSGLVALYCLAWAMDPDRFDMPMTRLGILDGTRAVAFTKLVNGVLLGTGTYVSACPSSGILGQMAA